jgi:vacuolar-type H+-ATPase subunit F/Vma7
MRDRVRVLCRPAVAAGFRLAGLDPVEGKDAAEGARRLLDVLEDPEAGVVLLEEDFHDALSGPERRALARRALPLVVPFPVPTRVPPPEGPGAFIAELLRQAIGYRVRLG